MAYLETSNHGNMIRGTDEDDAIIASGMRSKVFGAGGGDSIRAMGYLITVDGGDDDDSITAAASYVSINGDAGDDLLRVDTHFLGENIANVTLTGGEGADTLAFLPREHKIFSAIVTDFNAADGDIVFDFVDDDNIMVIADEDNGIIALRSESASLAATAGIERTDEIQRIIDDNAITEEEAALKNVVGLHASGDVLRVQKFHVALPQSERNGEEPNATRRVGDSERLIDLAQYLDDDRRQFALRYVGV